jgi:hypothetical protein
MIFNFKTREINRDMRKLTRTPMLIKKILIHEAINFSNSASMALENDHKIYGLLRVCLVLR